MRNVHVFSALAVLLVSGCATTQSTPESVAVQEQPAWSKEYFKVGARLFPRCQTYTPVGSRVNDSTWCLTDEEIARIDSSHDQARVDIMQRSSQLPSNISN